MKQEDIQLKMQDLAKLIKYSYKDLSYLEKAMHCQIVHGGKDGKNRKNYTNDSFATLGDALLKFILTEYLFDYGYDKNVISQNRKLLENNDTLYELCCKIGIYDYAYNDSCFSGEAPLENKVSHSKHDVYIEAIIAAIYKDKGMEYCKKWCIEFLKEYKILNY